MPLRQIPYSQVQREMAANRHPLTVGPGSAEVVSHDPQTGESMVRDRQTLAVMPLSVWKKYNPLGAVVSRGMPMDVAQGDPPIPYVRQQEPPWGSFPKSPPQSAVTARPPPTQPSQPGLPWWVAAAPGIANAAVQSGLGDKALEGLRYLASAPVGQLQAAVPTRGVSKPAATAGGGTTSAGFPTMRQFGGGAPLPMLDRPFGQPKAPAYNYHIEMLKSADAGDAYARDFTNLREQARAAAAESSKRGERFVFVPLHDYRDNTLHIVNANGADVVLDLKDEGDKREFLRMADKIGVSPMEIMEWSRRSSRPLMAYNRPPGNIGETAPDFGRFGRPAPEQGQVPSMPPRPGTIRSLAEGPSPPTIPEPRPPAPRALSVADAIALDPNEEHALRRLGMYDWDAEQMRPLPGDMARPAQRAPSRREYDAPQSVRPNPRPVVEEEPRRRLGPI
jgi:hypothetical protein